MDAKQRRKEILRLLKMDMKPLSATRLGEHFNVSRQIVVGDIALLRAAGENIIATSRGYFLNNEQEDDLAASDSYILSCCHDKSMLETELYTVVDNGGCFLNVAIEHPLYGTLSCDVAIGSRYEADEFLKKVALSGAKLLCTLTDGVHFHTIRCPSEEAYRRILTALKAKGLLYGAR